MKYLQNGGFQNHPLMRMTLLWALLFLAGLWVTNAAMYMSRMGLTPSSVRAYYLGSSEEFSQPKSSASLLETSHAHLPIMAIVMLLLTHLMIFAPYSDRVKRWFIALAFFSAFAGEGSGWLVRFVSPRLAWLKIACFLAFQTCLAFLIIGLAAFLLSARDGGKRSHPF